MISGVTNIFSAVMLIVLELGGPVTQAATSIVRFLQKYSCAARR